MSSRILPRVTWTVIAGVAGAFFQSAFHQHAGWPATIALGTLAVLSAARPFDGLLVLAGLGPLASIAGIVLGAPGFLHVPEAMTLAFITGAAAHAAVRPPEERLSRPVAYAAALLVLAALASGVVEGAVLLVERPNLLLDRSIPWPLIADHLRRSDALTAAIQFAEGPLLLVCAAVACDRRRDAPWTVPRAMIAGAAGAAAVNLVRLVSVWLQQPAAGFVDLFLNVRVNVQYGDLNAAGSHFAMVLVFAASPVFKRRMSAVLPTILIALALWLSGSRTALAAAGLVAVGRVVLTLRGRSLRASVPALAVLGSIAAIAIGAWLVYPHYRNDRPLRSLTTRWELGKAGLEMTADHPVFGVGIGRFRMLSREYAPAMLGVPEGENAHNNFIQILAESGIVGLALTCVLLGWPLMAAVRAGPDQRPWGLPAGLAAFLLTCLAGHPLLVPEAAYPFWIAFGVAATLCRRTPDPPIRPVWRVAAVAMGCLFVGSVPFRVQAAVDRANTENTSVGLSKWQRDPDGTRWRWAGGRATFYVDASASTIRIPFRVPAGSPPVHAVIFVDGREADQVDVRPGEPWTMRLFLLARRPARFARIDVEAQDPSGAPVGGSPTDTTGVLAIGQPRLGYQH